MRQEDFYKAFEAWCDADDQLYKECYHYLEHVLTIFPSHSVTIHEDSPVCVPYDGGNHPEYASNCFSRVNSVYMKDGEIYMDIEDCSEYCVLDIDAKNLFDVCEAVYNSLKQN